MVVRNLIGAQRRRYAAYVGDVRWLEMIEGVLGATNWELDIVGPVFADDEDAIRAAIGDD